MANQIMVYSFGRDSIKPYEPSPAKIETTNKKRLMPGTFKYEFIDFFRVGLGLPSLDDIVESN